MSIPAAAGYPQYSGNLITPMVSMELIELFYSQTIFGEVSTTEYAGELNQHGDQLTFWREPEVTIRDAVKDGTIKHDTLNSEPITLIIDMAKEFSIKMAKIDEFQIQNWEKFKEAMLRRASYQMARAIDLDILSSWYADIDANNKGANAGAVSGNYDLGVVGTPIALTSANIVEYLSYLNAVLNEQNTPREGRFLVLPTEGEVALLNSDLKAAYLTGEGTSSPYINGRLPKPVAGFDIYISTNMPVIDDGGTDVYEIVAGHASATAFASQIEETRIMEDKDSWDRYYQGLQVWGWKVMQPKALTGLFGSFS